MDKAKNNNLYYLLWKHTGKRHHLNHGLGGINRFYLLSQRFHRFCNRKYRLYHFVDGCIPFYAKAIGSCYCLKNIQSVISSDGFQGVYSLLSDKANVCRAFTFDYVIAEGLIYAIVIFSTFLNMFLKSSLVYLTQYESHTSVDKLQGSLLLKFFLAVYLNMTFTALIAYGNIPNLPKILVDTYIFQGYVILNFNFKFDINLFHFFLFLTVFFDL